MCLMAISVIKISLKLSAMDLIMSLQNVYVEVLTSNKMVFEDGTFEKY